MSLNVLGLLCAALLIASAILSRADNLPARLTPPKRRRRRSRSVPAQPAPVSRAVQPDRTELITALRGLGHRAEEARRIAAAVPARITDITEALAYAYSRHS